MSFVAARCRAVIAATAAVAACLLLGGLATASAAESTDPTGCPVVPTVQPFAPWQDISEYVLAPDGGLEDGGAGWELDGATVADGNESFNVGGPDHGSSLSMPAGSSATTAPMCIGEEHKTMRFFARGRGDVKVEVLYAPADGETKSVTLGNAVAGTSWKPTKIFPMRVNTLAPAQGNAMMVSFRFTSNGRGSSIDDVYVDPWRIR